MAGWATYAWQGAMHGRGCVWSGEACACLQKVGRRAWRGENEGERAWFHYFTIMQLFPTVILKLSSLVFFKILSFAKVIIYKRIIADVADLDNIQILMKKEHLPFQEAWFFLKGSWQLNCKLDTCVGEQASKDPPSP